MHLRKVLVLLRPDDADGILEAAMIHIGVHQLGTPPSGGTIITEMVKKLNLSWRKSSPGPPSILIVTSESRNTLSLADFYITCNFVHLDWINNPAP